MSASTPRVAQSPEDLCQSQWVAVFDGHDWTAYLLGPERGWLETAAGDGWVVILSDPPPEPVTVSREAFDRLAEALAWSQRASDDLPNGTWEDEATDRIATAAFALVDEVGAAE